MAPRLLAGERLVQITIQLMKVPRACESAAELDGIRTALFVPLRKDEALLGMIVSSRREVRPFLDKEVTLLENFAAQAVIAIENARLLTEQREALERQTATAEVLQIINASPGNLTPVLNAMLERAMRLCGAASGGLFTYDGERFHTVATLGVPVEAVEFRTKHPPTAHPGSGAAHILRTRRTHQTLDRMAEEDYQSGEPGARAMVELGGARTMLNVPLLKDDEVVGFFSVYRHEVRAFSDKQIALLENFAAQAVIAMENARLLTEQREALEQQTATAEVLQVINASPGNLVRCSTRCWSGRCGCVVPPLGRCTPTMGSSSRRWHCAVSPPPMPRSAETNRYRPRLTAGPDRCSSPAVLSKSWTS